MCLTISPGRSRKGSDALRKLEEGELETLGPDGMPPEGVDGALENLKEVLHQYRELQRHPPPADSDGLGEKGERH